MRTRPICLGCKFYHPSEIEFKCDAFPGGIPMDILKNEFDHRNPHGGDHGIRFEPKSPKDEEHAKFLFRKGPAKGRQLADTDEERTV